jgi:hypothetical protein
MPKSHARKKDPASIIAAARRPEDTVDLCFRPDVLADLVTLETELVEAIENDDDNRLGGAALEQRRLAEQIHALEEEAEANTVTFRVRALPNFEWRTAREKYPVRTEADKEFGWLVDRDALVRGILAVSVVDPDLPDPDLDAMADSLSSGQWEKLRDTILAVNGGDGSIPFSRSASRILRNSNNGAASHEPTDSQSGSLTDTDPVPSPV